VWLYILSASQLFLNYLLADFGLLVHASLSGASFAPYISYTRCPLTYAADQFYEQGEHGMVRV
jgi:hypothetical protein